MLQPLTGQAGWLHHYNRDLDQDHVSSPDMRFRIGLNQRDPGAWWHIAAARAPLGPPQWQAGFTKDTPEELIAAVADQLRRIQGQIDWTGESHPALREGAANLQEAADLLLNAGWREYASTDGVRLLGTADGLARAEIRAQADPFDLMGRCALAIEAGPADAGIPYWQALFTTDTPAVVTNAFIRALTDPTPLRRDRSWMDEQLLDDLERLASHNALADPPPPFTEEDLRNAAAAVCAGALDCVEDMPEMAFDQIRDEPIPSHQVSFSTWGRLPEGLRDLAALLVGDMLVAASERTGLLFGVDPAPSDSAGRFSKLPTPADPTPLRYLNFTNEDVRAAAVTASARQLYWACDTSGIGEVLLDQVISSSIPTGAPRSWSALPQSELDRAVRRVEQLIEEAAESAHLLLDPAVVPAPLALVSPAYLAGPGHIPELASRPLDEARWSYWPDEGDGAKYVHGPFHATARHSAAGMSWRLAFGSHRHPDTVLWSVDIGPRTPVEITAAIFTALERARLQWPNWNPWTTQVTADSALSPLEHAGWHSERVSSHSVWTEPVAGLASVERDTRRPAEGRSGDWILSGGSLDPSPPQGWCITMSRNIPAVLLTAAAEAITNPAPVERLARDLPSAHVPELDCQPLTRLTAQAAVSRADAARGRHGCLGQPAAPDSAPAAPYSPRQRPPRR
ncbi:DUF317 domain-containing protein [Streptacidiphilus sp. MAP5-52]|uniref:DUF317 domain-containing protein n=1 Tax=Streptacidiphilus sp. MAP5-52 TaxID=3156267 RepID=UPI003516E7E6